LKQFKRKQACVKLLKCLENIKEGQRVSVVVEEYKIDYERKRRYHGKFNRGKDACSKYYRRSSPSIS
jgi:ribosomal protein L21E